MINMDVLSLLLLPLLAGLGIAAIAGPLGAFVVWRRMAYFGDTLAHSALLGVALGVLADWNISIAMIFAGVLISIALWRLQKGIILATDTLLGILSHSALALGLICISLLSNNRINLFAYLFGDLLTVTIEDVALVFVCGGACLMLLLIFWRQLVMIAIDEDLSRVEGLAVDKLKLLLMILMATVVALSMKLVGVLLITALLIIPAATSRRLTHSPEAMAMVATVVAVMSVIGGLLVSTILDLPAGPAIVLCSSLLFFLSLLKTP